MILRSTERHFSREDGTVATLRVLEPSAPHGGWPGTECRIRCWALQHKGSSAIEKATPNEIIMLELELGEISNPKIIQHPTIGAVAKG